MKMVLQKDVKNLGKAGDSVQVKAGYARNYLLPKKLAMVLDERSLKEWKHKKVILEAKKRKAALERKSLLERLASVHLVFEKESRSEGRIFGSITPADISKALDEKHGFSVDKRDILIPSLKTLGEHSVQISLDSNLKTELKVTVKRKVSEKGKDSKGFFSKFLSGKKNSEAEKLKTDSAAEEKAQNSSPEAAPEEGIPESSKEDKN